MNEEYGPSVLRLVLGPLFLIPGIMKLMDPNMVVGMLEGLGFPAPVVFAWVLLLSELIFGTCVLIGWKTNYAVWPLVVILAVATAMVHIPAIATNPMGLITVIFHLLGIAALVSVYLTGPGAVAVQK